MAVRSPTQYASQPSPLFWEMKQTNKVGPTLMAARRSDLRLTSALYPSRPCVRPTIGWIMGHDVPFDSWPRSTCPRTGGKGRPLMVDIDSIGCPDVVGQNWPPQ